MDRRKDKKGPEGFRENPPEELLKKMQHAKARRTEHRLRSSGVRGFALREAHLPAEEDLPAEIAADRFTFELGDGLSPAECLERRIHDAATPHEADALRRLQRRLLG